MTFSSLGKKRRMKRLLSNGKMLIVPVDDSLIDGAKNGLYDLDNTIRNIANASPSAIMGYKAASEYVGLNFDVPFIYNVTASTVLNSHTRKVMIATVENAISSGADCVAVHINFTDEYESEMLAQFANISNECDKYGVPLFALAYPRKSVHGKDYNYFDLRESNPKEYAELVAHCVRVVCELGADIVKTQYTGDKETFGLVTGAACGRPVVIAGGPEEPVEESLQKISDSICSGGAGICFGRNIFNSQHILEYITAAKSIIFDGCDYSTATVNYYNSIGDSENGE